MVVSLLVSRERDVLQMRFGTLHTLRIYQKNYANTGHAEVECYGELVSPLRH